ncbi:MAG: PPC domain-containing DNA-binding protein [Betaproteobacteria bacterium]
MRAKVLNESHGRVFAVVFDIGEDPVSGLTQFAEQQNLTASGFTAIGAFSEATLGYFQWSKKEYERIPVTEQTEVLALVGDIAVDEQNRRKVHAHVVLGRRDGAACGGHLLAAKVRPTLEVILTESPAYLQRVHDPQTGLALIRIGG